MEGAFSQWKKLTLGGAAALIGAVGCAHSSANETAQVNAAEVQNPHAADNKDRPVDAVVDTHAVNANEQQDPNSVRNKDRVVDADVPKRVTKVETAAAEQGNPDSVDSAKPLPNVVLQRLHAMNTGALVAAQLDASSGSPDGATYASMIVRDRQQSEAAVQALAAQLNARLELSDPAAIKRANEYAAMNSKLQGYNGPALDRKFVRESKHTQMRDLEITKDLRRRTIDPQLIGILDSQIQMLERDQASASSIQASADPSDDPRP